MKISWIVFSTIILFIPSLVFCNKIFPERRITKTLTMQDEGKTVEMKAGESFQLVLRNPGSGGYLVQEPPEFDSQMLTLENTEKKAPQDPSRDGDFGNIVWTFYAEQEGNSILTVTALRPWEKKKDPILIFKATLHITR